MQKLLSQDEIDAIVRAARGGKSARTATAAPKVSHCDFRQASQLRKHQVRAISTLHDTFARNLTHWMGAYLRVGFECNTVSVEQVTFGEIMSRLPELVYLASIAAEPHKSEAALHLELSAAFPMIDLLLGGPGRPGPQRDLTSIEEQIIADVMRIICRELSTAWQPVGVTFQFEQRQQPEQLQRLMPPRELALALSFEIRIAGAQGTLNLVFPGALSDLLLRQLAREWTYHSPRGGSDWGDRLRGGMLDCEFPIDVVLPATSVRAASLVQLQAGDVLELGLPVDTPARLRVGGEEAFAARVVCRNEVRAAQLQERVAEQAR